MLTVSQARLTDLAEVEINGLQAEGITPTPAEIVTINAISHAIATPERRVALAGGIPVQCANVTLWPLTMYGYDWMDRNATGRNERQDTMMLAYAMAHPDADLPEGGQTRKVIKAWGKTLRCSYAQIREAVQCIHDQSEYQCTDRKPSGNTLGDLSLTLASLTHTDPAIWERRVCLSYATAAVVELIDRARADHGQEADPNNNPTLRYEKMMGLYLNRIRSRHERENHGA